MASWEDGRRDPGALWGLSPSLHFPWLPLQGPPGMRGSPGPPGPIVSIRGFLAHLRSSRRGCNAQIPLCCLVSRKLVRAEGGKFYRLPLSLIRASVGTVDSTTRAPGTGLLCSALLVVLLQGGPPGHTPASPSPSLHCPARWTQAPLAGGPGLLARGLGCQESMWQPDQISSCLHATSRYGGRGLRRNSPASLCRAISRTGLQRPGQGCPPWSPPWCCYGGKLEVPRKDWKNQKCFLWRTGGWWEPPSWGHLEVRWRARWACTPARVSSGTQEHSARALGLWGLFLISADGSSHSSWSQGGGAGVFIESLFQLPWK